MTELVQESFSTRSMRPEDQFEAWREWFRPVFEVTPTWPSSAGFVADNHVWRLGGMAVSKVSAPSVRSARKIGNVRRAPVDHWVITVCRRGSSRFLTGERAIEAAVGVPFLWSMGEPSYCERTQVDRTQVMLTRDAFRAIGPQLDEARGTVLGTPLGLMLADYIAALERRLPALSRSDLPRLAAAVGAMVAAAIEPSPDRVALARRQIDLGRLERVRQAVRLHLRSPALGPATLCRAIGVSRSNLYRLLEDAGGVARYIQTQRLAEAHAALAEPRSQKPISAIAEEFCFPDPSTFSRAFKREFGYSPSEIKAAAPTALAPLPRPRPQVTGEAAEFRELLRDF